MQIREAVITGTEGSGLHSAEAYLVQKLSDRGWQVLLVPDALDLLTGSGAQDIKKLCQDPANMNLLISLLQTQHALRLQWLSVAKNLADHGERIVLLHKRTPLDFAPHVADYEALLVKANLTLKDVRDGFDLILIMQSFKEPDQTDHLVKIWTGAPHVRLVRVDNETEFRDKLRNLWSAARRVLAETGFEIEHKYLLAKPPTREELLLMGAVEVEIYQTYLHSVASDIEQRLRKRICGAQVTYYHTIKRRLDDLQREETERIITWREYNELFLSRDQQRGQVHKKRYCLLYDENYLELDMFINPPDLVLLEVEVSDAKDRVSLPESWQVLREVTGEAEWTNHEIALKAQEDFNEHSH